MPIAMLVDRRRRLATFTLTGAVSLEEVRAALQSFYGGTEIPPNVLWDCRNSDPADLSADEVRRIVEQLGRHEDRFSARQGGKTAVVVPSDLSFGLARMAQILAESSKEPLPFEVRVFRDMEDAERWLAETPGCP